MSLDPSLLDAVRARFLHVDECPFEGPRVFFENAGGALHLKSVAETSARYAGYPDNQDRDNAASRALMAAIEKGRADSGSRDSTSDWSEPVAARCPRTLEGLHLRS